MSNISNYLQERMKTVDLQIDLLKTKQKNIDDEISSICEKQKKFSEGTDVTYELFSPKPVNSRENRESIQILEVNKYELLSQKKELEKEAETLLQERESIKNSMSDLRKMEIFINKAAKQYHLNEP